MIGWLSRHAYLGRIQRELCHRGMAILTYHRIGSPPAGVPDPFLYDTPADLDQHLRIAKARGLKLAPFGEAATSEHFTPNTLTITFDDGFTSVLQHGLPVLQAHQARAIQFVVAGLVGKKNQWDAHKRDSIEPLMDWFQLREWLAAGMEIGSHSLTHPNLKKLKAAEAREEITASKKLLEDKLGVPIHHFCYPHGGWTPVVRDLVIDAGYKSACAVRLGVAESRSDLWTLPRIAPLTSWRLVKKIHHRALRRLRGHPHPAVTSQSEY
jgi:peptidoglycan/xylan/chitin deacetylase (PgdA/CDA1 family)